MLQGMKEEGGFLTGGEKEQTMHDGFARGKWEGRLPAVEDKEKPLVTAVPRGKEGVWRWKRREKTRICLGGIVFQNKGCGKAVILRRKTILACRKMSQPAPKKMYINPNTAPTIAKIAIQVMMQRMQVTKRVIDLVKRI